MIERKFGLHGQYSLQIINQILIIRASGPANLELIEQYVIDVENQVDILRGKGQWCTLIILSGTPLLPPDASRLIEDTIASEKRAGLCASAVVLNDVEYAQSASRYWLDFYAKTNVTAAVFEDENSALSWLAEQIPN